MPIKNSRDRDDEGIRVFSHEEILKIKEIAHQWFVGMASYDGSIDEDFSTECVAEATYRLLVSTGRIKDGV